LLEAEVAKEFLARVVGQARARGWKSDEHFTVDGTLLEAWASVLHWEVLCARTMNLLGAGPTKENG